MFLMSRASHSTGQPVAPRRAYGLWFLLIALLILGVAGFSAATVMVARASESPAFRQLISARLAQRLGADVELGKIDSTAIVFLSIPEIRVSAHDQRWAVILQGVTLELDWRLLLQREWTFHSAQAQTAELWLGVTDTPSAVLPSAPQPVAMLEAGDSEALPDWLKALLFRGRTGAVVDSIRIAKLSARGPAVASPGPVFEFVCLAEGRYARGKLDWKLSGGTFRGGGQEAWQIDSLVGAVNRGVWEVKGGHLQAGGGTLEITGTPTAPGEIGMAVSVVNLGMRTLTGGTEASLGPLNELAIGLKGTLFARFPELHQFRFEGALQGEKLRMGASRVFEILAGQTGEPRLASLQSDVITGRIEWTPGLVRLYDLAFGEPDLVRMEGRLSVVASEIAGVFDLELPVALVGRFPGGKPDGFSYPAAGWSRAQLRVRGPVTGWTEDLTRRLLEQIPAEISVGAGPSLAGPHPETPPTGSPVSPVTNERAIKVEELFNQLVRN